MNLEKKQKELLEMGNLYTFATALIELYPDIAEKNGFGMEEAENYYELYAEFNDGIFTFRGKCCKYFFDTEMWFRGTKF